MSAKTPHNKDQDVVTIKPEDFMKDTSVYKNISQEVITVTYDKIKLCLIEQQNGLAAKNGWMAPVGLLVALVAALVTSDFRSFLNISPDIWKALFILGSILSGIWTVLSVYRIYQFRKTGGIEYIIKKLKG